MKKIIFLFTSIFLFFGAMSQKPNIQIMFSFQKKSITSQEIETTIKIIKKRLKLKNIYTHQTKIYSQNTENGLPSICIELHLIPDDFLISYLSTQGKMHFYNMYFFSAIEQLIIPNSAFKDSLFTYLQNPPKEEKHNIELVKYCRKENKKRVDSLLTDSQIIYFLGKEKKFIWGKTDSSFQNKSIPLYVIHTNAFLTEKNIKKVKIEKTPGYYDHQLNFQFDSLGSSILQEITSANKGNPIAITFDDEVFMTPMIMQEIAGGKLNITGTGISLNNANDFVHILESGTLPSKLIFHSINYISNKK